MRVVEFTLWLWIHALSCLQVKGTQPETMESPILQDGEVQVLYWGCIIYTQRHVAVRGVQVNVFTLFAALAVVGSNVYSVFFAPREDCELEFKAKCIEPRVKPSLCMNGYVTHQLLCKYSSPPSLHLRPHAASCFFCRSGPHYSAFLRHDTSSRGHRH